MSMNEADIEQRLRESTVPGPSTPIPRANAIVQRDRRARSIRRTAVSGGAAVVLLALMVAASGRDDSDAKGSDQFPAASQELIAEVDQLPTSGAPDNDSPRIRLILGVMNDAGYMPVTVQAGSREFQTTGFGYIVPQQVRQVPVWQLPQSTQNEIHDHWTEVGYQPTLEL